MSGNLSDNVRILVTGGVGFLGSAIVDAFTEQCPAWEIDVLDLAQPEHVRGGMAYHVCDVTEARTVDETIGKARSTMIVHTAGLVPEGPARYSRRDEARIHKVNIEGTRNVVEAAKKHGVKALIYTSSCTAVTDDLSKQFPNVDERWPVSFRSLPYGESKAAAEAIVLAANKDSFATTSIRPFPIIGPGDPLFITYMVDLINQGLTPFCIGEGFNLWDFVYVSNIADAHVLAAKNLLGNKTAAGQAFFISNGEPLPLRDICLGFWKELGYSPPFELHIPVWLINALGRIADLVSSITGVPGTLSRGSAIDGYVTRYCSNGKATEILGYVPNVGIEEGIRRSCDEYKSRKGILP